VYRFSRKDCIGYALENSNTMKNAKADVISAKYFLVENRAIGLPQISAGFQVQDAPILATSPVPGEFFGQPGTTQFSAFQPRSSALGELELSQLLFDGRYIIALRVSRVYNELARRNAKRSEVETITAVSKAYYAVLINEKRLALFDANKERLTKILSEAQAQKDNGFAQQIDVDRLQVSLNNLETEQENAKRLVVITRSLLKFQMGLPPDAMLELTDVIDESDVTVGQEDLTKTLNPESRVEYGIFKTNIRLNEMDVLRYRAGFLPTLSGRARYATQSFQPDLAQTMQTGRFWVQGLQWSIGLNIPIFDGFMKNAQVQQAKMRLLKSRNDLENLQNNLTLQHETARTNMLNALKQLEIQKRNVTLAESVYRIAQARYKEGIGTNLELVEAESSFKTSQTNYINALLETYVNRVELQQALGLITADNY